MLLRQDWICAGKGMHSRLYTRVLAGNPWVQHCGAINNMYNDTGLVGIMATCDSSQADSMVGLMVDEFQVSLLDRHCPCLVACLVLQMCLANFAPAK